MNIKERIKRSFKLRFAILYPFALLPLLFSHPSDELFFISSIFIILGLSIRVWANGYAIKMGKLTTSGPYAYVRNPLYLGTMFIVIGFSLMLDITILSILFILIAFFVYINTIRKEEKMLEAKFKDSYTSYRNKVPALIFTIFPYRAGEKWPFSFKRLLESKEHKPVIWVIIFLIALYVKNEVTFRGKALDSRLAGLILAEILLGMMT
jgi:protein-S-isoprenylcysteine O-methyltransferase Ste14